LIGVGFRCDIIKSTSSAADRRMSATATGQFRHHLILGEENRDRRRRTRRDPWISSCELQITSYPAIALASPSGLDRICRA